MKRITYRQIQEQLSKLSQSELNDDAVVGTCNGIEYIREFGKIGELAGDADDSDPHSYMFDLI